MAELLRGRETGFTDRLTRPSQMGLDSMSDLGPCDHLKTCFLHAPLCHTVWVASSHCDPGVL